MRPRSSRRARTTARDCRSEPNTSATPAPSCGAQHCRFWTASLAQMRHERRTTWTRARLHLPDHLPTCSGRRDHRPGVAGSPVQAKVNVGMLASAAVLLVITIASLIAAIQLSSTLSSITNGSFAAVNTAADTRIDANNAKSNESLTLIARGSGQAFEAAWKSSADSVAANLQHLTDRPELMNQWQAYTNVHGEIRALDDGGRWDRAVTQATGSDPASSNTVFGTFDNNLAGYLDEVSQETSSSLAGIQPVTVVFAILALLSGLAVALLGRWGIAARLKEYR